MLGVGPASDETPAEIVNFLLNSNGALRWRCVMDYQKKWKAKEAWAL